MMDGSNIIYLCCLITLLTLHFSFCTTSSAIKCIASEREALLTFKHHLIDSTNRLSSWNSSNINCCHWAAVVCSNVTSHVLQLHLNPSYFHYEHYVTDEAYEMSKFGGEINPSLADLNHLSYLDLSANDFGGTQIPTFIFSMTTLTHLDLFGAGFGGKIPHQIGNLSSLLHLDLSYNKVIGTIPYQIGNLTNLLHLGIGPDFDEPLQFVENFDWLLGLSSLQYLGLSNINLSKSSDWLHSMQVLPSLQELYLTYCALHHYNQPSTVNFSSLVTLQLFHTYFTGNSFVPQWIFGLKKLAFLRLASCEFQGSIPDGIRNLTLLENLDLSYNSFSSYIPDWIYGLRHLKSLQLQRNNLRGTISNAVGNLTSLVSLNLMSNKLEGIIPASLGNLCSLTDISLSSAKCNQHVSEILQILTPCVSHGLKTLEVESSQLSGNLTDQIGIFKNLITLSFHDNSIQGELPRPLANLLSLRTLDLSNNQFTGNPFEVPRSLCKLVTLNLGYNLFQGVVKERDLSNFTSLGNLYASMNDLTLTVSTNWNPSFQIEWLYMGSWHLGPNFPSWIQSQKNLLGLDISSTGISDSIPTWFWKSFPQARYFNLSHNQIRGELTNTINSWTYLDLSSNHITGQLPYLSVGVSWLDLSNNSFSGSMTDFLCEKQDSPKNIEYMNLAANNLSGEIPDCWTTWPYIVDLRLQRNFFTGNLPLSMGSLSRLESLRLHDNALSGEFPCILKNISKLVSLDLGGNKLSGVIPSWVGERLLNLKILRLRANKFHGHIPNQICALHFLQVLDLAQNHLSGNIPNCFNHFGAMLIKNNSLDSLIICKENNTSISAIGVFLWLKGRSIEYSNLLGMVTSIDLSNNNLTGEIPREITDLLGLRSLNLSRNQLIGKIPQSIGNMKTLEAIDFSRNHLSGEIPPTIANLNFLSQLDLSYNHLKGKIPTGTQLQTFEAFDFVGNDLCGPPLLNSCSPHEEILNAHHKDKESDRHEVNWFFVSMAFGFIVGFWGVVVPLFIHRSWRHAYFGFLDDMWYKSQSCW